MDGKPDSQGRVVLNVRVKPGVREWIRAQAVKEGVTQSEVLRQMVKIGLESYKPARKPVV